jgi:hypothetical protein
MTAIITKEGITKAKQVKEKLPQSTFSLLLYSSVLKLLLSLTFKLHLTIKLLLLLIF